MVNCSLFVIVSSVLFASVFDVLSLFSCLLMVFVVHQFFMCIVVCGIVRVCCLLFVVVVRGGCLFDVYLY